MHIGCIFDWDGVIIDSSEHHIEGWRRLAREEKLVFPEHLFKQSFGMKNEQIIPQLWKWTDDTAEIQRIDRKKEAMYRDIMREKGITAQPGVERLISLVKKENIPCAIGSSAPLENITTGLELLGWADLFEAVVSGSDVVLGKPDPQIFLLAAQRIGKHPSHCVVFEDAQVGVAAALTAGMKVVAVTNTYPADKLKDADMVVDNLERVSLDRLERLFNLSE
jgi:5-amino-6-(5-phospho-D-ribitylamino)uracil phosphatase